MEDNKNARVIDDGTFRFNISADYSNGYADMPEKLLQRGNNDCCNVL